MNKVRSTLRNGLAVILIIASSLPTLAADTAEKQESRPVMTTMNLVRGGEIKLVSDDSTQHLPVVLVSINGSEPLQFVLDTGADCDFIIEPWVVGKLKLPPVPMTKPSDSGKKQVKSVVLLSADRKSDIPVSVGAIPVFDKSIFTELTEEKIAGIIGVRFLLDKQLIINPDTKTISLLPSPTAPLPPSTGKKTSLIPSKDGSDKRFFIDCDVPGAGKVPFLLDTGASKVRIGGRVARKVPLRIDSEPEERITAEGTVSAHRVYFPEVRFGPLIEKNVLGVTASSNQDNLLGMSLLKRFVITIDFPRKEMFLKPIQDYDTVVESYGEPGFLLVEKDNKFVATAIYSDSPAYKNGVSPNSEIIAVNGKKIGPEDGATISRLKEGPVGSRVTLQLRRKTGEVYDAEVVYIDPYKSLDTPLPVGVNMNVKPSEDNKTIASMSVISVVPKSRAARAGVKEGDVVESINGKAIAGMTVDELVAQRSEIGTGEMIMLMKREGAKKPVRIRIPGGKAKTLRDLL